MIRRLETKAHRHVIIAMTAGALQADREQCFNAGMDDFIGKPVMLEELAAKLSNWAGPPPVPTPVQNTPSRRNPFCRTVARSQSPATPA